MQCKTPRPKVRCSKDHKSNQKVQRRPEKNEEEINSLELKNKRCSEIGEHTFEAMGQCQNLQFQEEGRKYILRSLVQCNNGGGSQIQGSPNATVPRDLRLRHLNKYCTLATDLLAKSTGGYTYPPLRTSPDVPSCLTCGLTNSPQSFGRRPLSQGPAPKSRQPHRPSHPPPPCSPNCCCRVRRCWAPSLRRLRGSRCSLDSAATPSGGEQCTRTTAPVDAMPCQPERSSIACTTWRILHLRWHRAEYPALFDSTR